MRRRAIRSSAERSSAVKISSIALGSRAIAVSRPAEAVSASLSPKPDPNFDLTGTGVILLSQEPSWIRFLAGRLERLGACGFVSAPSDTVSSVLASGLDDCQRIAVVVDGQGVDPVELALAVRAQAAFGRVSLILLTTTHGLPPLAWRRQCAATISAASSDREISTELQTFGAREIFRQRPRKGFGNLPCGKHGLCASAR